MSTRAKAPFLIAVALLAMPGLTAAQKLQPGTWTGTITPPDNPSVDATFEVAESGDSVTIMLNVIGMGEMPPMPFSNIRVMEDRILFRFEPGTTVDCTLMLKEDGSYAGDCVDGNGETGVIVMKPPAKTPEPATRTLPRA